MDSLTDCELQMHARLKSTSSKPVSFDISTVAFVIWAIFLIVKWTFFFEMKSDVGSIFCCKSTAVCQSNWGRRKSTANGPIISFNDRKIDKFWQFIVIWKCNLNADRKVALPIFSHLQIFRYCSSKWEWSEMIRRRQRRKHGTNFKTTKTIKIKPNFIYPSILPFFLLFNAWYHSYPKAENFKLHLTTVCVHKIHKRPIRILCVCPFFSFHPSFLLLFTPNISWTHSRRRTFVTATKAITTAEQNLLIKLTNY